ncbi:MAG: hypothetical protein ACLPWS_08895 [Rhodomicrobium sp.]
MSTVDRNIVSSIAPASRGFGYVLFAARAEPVNWGVKEIRTGKSKNRQVLAKIEVMLGEIVPAVLVLEDRRHKECRRSVCINVLLKRIAALGEAQGLTINCHSRREIGNAFGKKGKSKDAIAARIVDEVTPPRP